MTKQICRYLSLLLVATAVSCNKENTAAGVGVPDADQINFVQNVESYFELSYTTAGLGSNMDALMPTYILRGEKFTYLLSQNSSFSGKFYKPSELLCEGSVRKSSIDSIIRLIAFIPDSVIYNTNLNIRSGVYQTLLIETEAKKIRFDMHNGYDTTAAQVINILNSNLPEGQRKLLVFGSSHGNRS